MFKIIEGDFKNNIYGNEEYLDNWPMLYLLEKEEKQKVTLIRDSKGKNNKYSSKKFKLYYIN